MRKTLVITGLTVLLLLTAALFWVVQSRRANVLWEFSENEVFVRVEVKQRASGEFELMATFTPTRERFHLYSKDLPKSGISGLGRPTLLEVVSPSSAIRLTGPLVAYQPTRELHFKSLGLIFPVYPEGPVVLGLPFAFTGQAAGADSVEISVTYMACSDQVCLAPVVDRRFTVNLPRNP